GRNSQQRSVTLPGRPSNSTSHWRTASSVSWIPLVCLTIGAHSGRRAVSVKMRQIVSGEALITISSRPWTLRIRAAGGIWLTYDVQEILRARGAEELEMLGEIAGLLLQAGLGFEVLLKASVLAIELEQR